MVVGLLTGGGDCPGLNAVIRAVARKITNAGGSCLGFMEGWRGMVENIHRPLDPMETDDILGIGGTILGSSRTNPFKKPESIEKIQTTFKVNDLAALVAIGGEEIEDAVEIDVGAFDALGPTRGSRERGRRL